MIGRQFEFFCGATCQPIGTLHTPGMGVFTGTPPEQIIECISFVMPNQYAFANRFPERIRYIFLNN
jgi:hypothetical protein